MIAGCGGGGREAASEEEAAAIEVAIRASREEGILLADPIRAGGEAMPLDAAERELSAWGAVFADFADYPPPDTRVWVVEILGEGVQPGPPGGGQERECLEIRVVVLEDRR
jgi:hypothetical protein